MPPLDKLPTLKSRRNVKTLHHKTVFVETFERPDGSTSEWFLFEGDGKPCVVVFAITRDETKGWMVVTVKHFRYGASEVIHELPGGGVKQMQSDKEAAQCELMEETGYKVDLANVYVLGEPMWFEPAAMRAKYQPMMALDASDTGNAHPEPDEFMDVELVPIDKWFKKIVSGEISDAKSVAVSMRALEKLPGEIKAQLTAFI